MAKVVRVIISNIIKKIDQPYDYVCSFEGDLIGKRAIVPFGKSNSPRKALILDCYESDEIGSLKQVIDILDDAPVINKSQIPLISFLKEQYFISHYKALSCLIPAGLDYKVKKVYCYTGNEVLPEFKELVAFVTAQKKAITLETFPPELRNLGDLSDKMLTLAVSVETVEDYLQNLPARFEGQKELLELLLEHSNIAAKEALYLTGCSVSSIQTLSKKGLIHIYYEQRSRTPYDQLTKTIDHSEIKLNTEQKDVLEKIASNLDQGRQTHLIHGVTGSGKTHIYMKLIDRVLSDKKSVLFLVPEISLTPQTLSKFFARYGDKVAVVHSGLSMGQRMDEWKKIKNAE